MTQKLSKQKVDELVQAAIKARTHAYAPYSQCDVGAALLLEDGSILTGANVENASFGLSICAERTVVAHAVASGHRRFAAIAIATSASPPWPPCGMCRQVLVEFAPNIPIILANLQGERSETTLEKIFPAQFSRKDM